MVSNCHLLWFSVQRFFNTLLSMLYNSWVANHAEYIVCFLYFYNDICIIIWSYILKQHLHDYEIHYNKMRRFFYPYLRLIVLDRIHSLLTVYMINIIQSSPLNHTMSCHLFSYWLSYALHYSKLCYLPVPYISIASSVDIYYRDASEFTPEGSNFLLFRRAWIFSTYT